MEKLFKSYPNQSNGVERKKVLYKKQIIRNLFFYGSMSNSRLSTVLKLSTPKINNLLLALIDEGLVQEVGRGDSSGGRPPVLYHLAENCFYVAAISVNLNRTDIAVFNCDNVPVAEPGSFNIRLNTKFDIFHQLNRELERILEKLQIRKEKVLVTGIEMPGLYNQKNDINKTFFPGIVNLPEKLNEIFGIPVVIGHDAKVRTFAEQHFGLAKNKRNMLLLHVDWGLGLGIVINGKLYSGKSGYSGEFGHLPIVNNGILCSCGNYGCLETAASANAIIRHINQEIQSGQPSLIRELVKNEPDTLNISTVIEAARRGDKLAVSVLTEAASWLGKGIGFLIQIFNPELIIIGGCVADASDIISEPVHLSIKQFSNGDISNDTQVKFSELGQKAGITGVAAYALDRMAAG